MMQIDSFGRVVNARLTKHGRKRYLERINPDATDADIIRDCFAARYCVEPDPHAHRRFHAVWSPDDRLVTVFVR